MMKLMNEKSYHTYITLTTLQIPEYNKNTGVVEILYLIDKTNCSKKKIDDTCSIYSLTKEIKEITDDDIIGIHKKRDLEEIEILYRIFNLNVLVRYILNFHLNFNHVFVKTPNLRIFITKKA